MDFYWFLKCDFEVVLEDVVDGDLSHDKVGLDLHNDHFVGILDFPHIVDYELAGFNCQVVEFPLESHFGDLSCELLLLLVIEQLFLLEEQLFLFDFFVHQVLFRLDLVLFVVHHEERA